MITYFEQFQANGNRHIEAVSPAIAVQRRPYGSDGIRNEAPVEPLESTMEESSFEEPTEPIFKVHCDESNKGKVKLTKGLGKNFGWAAVVSDFRSKNIGKKGNFVK